MSSSHNLKSFVMFWPKLLLEIKKEIVMLATPVKLVSLVIVKQVVMTVIKAILLDSVLWISEDGF